jgi:crossover junction endodeoxyribonuclease RusA
MGSGSEEKTPIGVTHRLRLPYPISGNRYWRNYRGRVTLSEEAKIYKREVWYAAVRGDVRMLHGDVVLHVELHPRTTKSGEASKTCIDTDNGLKVVLDALQGIAYENDKQIVEIRAKRGAPMPNGGVTVEWSETKGDN